MLSIIRNIVKYVSTSKGAKLTLTAWIIAVIALSVFAPSAKEYEESSSEGSINEDTPSEIAEDILDKQFPTDDGLTALIVFHKDEGLNETDIEEVTQFSEWLASDEKPKNISSALPFHQFPKEVQAQMFSDDETTLLFNIALKENLDASVSHDTLEELKNKWASIGSKDTQFEITGPAGITADTISLFQNADIVLILATVGLIFIILIFIYRSPLLAITPLIIAGIVYGVVDRVLGLLGKYDIFVIEGQAISIMLVLLFAVITDYSLFVFSRYREELHKYKSKYDAMDEAIYHVAEPIFFSGGTVILAMLTLFVTIFNAYHNFAPVFSVAVFFILIAGITLIPALFEILGRKAFWPSIPKVDDAKQQKRKFWTWVSKIVVERPTTVACTLIVFLLIGAVNVLPIQLSFNLLKSFPEDISSRAGFELLEENYPAGELAPVTVVLESNDKIEVDKNFLEKIQSLQTDLSTEDGISKVNSEITEDIINGEADLPRNFLSPSKEAIKFQFVLNSNPYERESMETVESLRENAESLLVENGFDVDTTTLHLAGQTPSQLDVKNINKRDMIILFTLVSLLLTIVLGFQTRSVLLPALMMGTILLSFVATLGFGWIIFKNILGYDAIGYRIPVYTFIFMVALGIDYNIMLVSRIKEFAVDFTWKEAVQKGIKYTGSVISSAGLILAATFSVLVTQPIQELFLFGFLMAIGILLDTFIIRGFFLPSILILTHRKK